MADPAHIGDSKKGPPGNLKAGRGIDDNQKRNGVPGLNGERYEGTEAGRQVGANQPDTKRVSSVIRSCEAIGAKETERSLIERSTRRTDERTDGKEEGPGVDQEWEEQESIASCEELYQNAHHTLNQEGEQPGIDALKAVVNAYPEFANAYSDLGALYSNMGKKDKALENYQKAARIEPDNFDFQKNLAHFYYAVMGEIDSAVEHYGRAMSSNPEDIDTLLMLGHISVSKRRFEEAVVFYNKVTEIDPENQNAKEILSKLTSKQPKIVG